MTLRKRAGAASVAASFSREKVSPARCNEPTTASYEALAACFLFCQHDVGGEGRRATPLSAAVAVGDRLSRDILLEWSNEVECEPRAGSPVSVGDLGRTCGMRRCIRRQPGTFQPRATRLRRRKFASRKGAARHHATCRHHHGAVGRRYCATQPVRHSVRQPASRRCHMVERSRRLGKGDAREHDFQSNDLVRHDSDPIGCQHRYCDRGRRRVPDRHCECSGRRPGRRTRAGAERWKLELLCPGARALHVHGHAASSLRVGRHLREPDGDRRYGLHQ